MTTDAAPGADLTDPGLAVAPPGPVTWSQRDRAWVVSRYEEIQTILRARATESVNPATGLARVCQRTGRDHADLSAVMNGTPPLQSGGVHRRTREVIRGIIGSRMARWTPQALRKAAEGLVARVDGPGCLDVVRAFADPMPTLVIADVLDMSTEQVQWLRTCGGAVAALPQFAPSLGDYARIDALCAEVHAMLSNSGWPEGSPRAAAMQPRAGELGYAVADLVFAVTSAAGNTTAASIAATLNLLAHNPVHQAALRDAPELIGAFVRESLRLAGPVRRLARQAATAAMIVGGVAISAGDALLLDIERAHRDLAAFPAPGSIDLSRKGPPLLAFGGGAHACQGAVIGHLQVEAMVWAVLGRFSLLPLPSGGRLVLHPHLRQFASLPLLLVPWPDQARGHSG